jgi:hypothetical protein
MQPRECLTMRWSERPPAARPRSTWRAPIHCGPRTPPVAVAHLILVRRTMKRVLNRIFGVLLFIVLVGWGASVFCNMGLSILLVQIRRGFCESTRAQFG